MSRPAAICGSRPAGKVSVMMQTKPVIASASRAASGRRAEPACVVVELRVVTVLVSGR